MGRAYSAAVALHELEVLQSAPIAAIRLSEAIAERARAVVAARGKFTMALSGGSAPRKAFRLLADTPVPWKSVEIFQVDERIAPAGSDERNLTHLEENLPAAAWARVHPMPVEADDLEAAAAEYAALLPERLDLIHLGLGPDGHTASLVPGDTVLDVRDRDVALTANEYQGTRRMTLTYPMIERAYELLWLVTGEEKAAPLQLLLDGDPRIPAGRIRAESSVIIADPDAAGS
jgi:6-phosphogluconolactonase